MIPIASEKICNFVVTMIFRQNVLKTEQLFCLQISLYLFIQFVPEIPDIMSVTIYMMCDLHNYLKSFNSVNVLDL